MWTCDKCGEKIEDQFDSCWKCAGKPDPIGLPLKSSHRQIMTGIVLASALIPATWICFGPIFAFHGMAIFGITACLVLNSDDPMPGDHMWGDYGVRFFPGRFAIAVVLWLILIYVIFKLVRYLAK